MKIALVYDDLIQFGGGENLLLDVHKIWPEAPIFTSVASNRWQEICKREKINLQTSFLQKFPFKEKLNRYYAPFLLHMLAFESFDFSDFDVVVSVSNRFAHGVITKPTTLHICYMNTPGRMFWEPASYFRKENKYVKLFSSFLDGALSYIRLWDYAASKRVDYFIANSKTAQSRIKKYYGRNSVVINPCISVSDFSRIPSEPGKYFLVISRLVPWKRIDLAVEACTKLNLPLKVIGDGSDLGRLRKIAGRSVDFLGYVSDDLKKHVIAKSIAVVHPQKEDFGVVPLEAMAMGKPVIAYSGGGALETIVPGETGEFFEKQSVESLSNVLSSFEPKKYSAFACSNRAHLFDIEVFKRKVKQYVNTVYLESTK